MRFRGLDREAHLVVSFRLGAVTRSRRSLAGIDVLIVGISVALSEDDEHPANALLLRTAMMGVMSARP